MQELLKNAWQGWLYYTENGKYAALLLVALLYLWFRRERCKEQVLLVYTTIVTGCCIFPVTAAILMKYQTLFYNYEWIWGCVPVTLMISYGATVFWHEQKQKRNGIYATGLALAMIVIIGLCGRMGRTMEGAEWNGASGENVREVLALLEPENGEHEILLWAPKAVMEVTRGLQPDIRLIYGRDMWEAALGAYSYDVYSETQQQLYLWMCNVEETGSLTYTMESGIVLDGEWGVRAAEAMGVNTILLPGNTLMEELQLLLNGNGLNVKTLCGYYVLVL